MSLDERIIFYIIELHNANKTDKLEMSVNIIKSQNQSWVK